MSATVNSPEAIAQAALIGVVVLAAYFLLRAAFRAVGRYITRRLASIVDCALADCGTDDEWLRDSSGEWPTHAPGDPRCGLCRAVGLTGGQQ